MPNGLLAQEAQAAAMGGSGYPSGGAGPAGLTQGQGPPPPAALCGQQPAGAMPQQGQPTPGFPEMASQMLQVLVQGNEADLQIFGQMIAQLQTLVEGRQGQQPQQTVPMGAAPQGPTIP
jgi:hypothetical protein